MLFIKISLKINYLPCFRLLTFSKTLFFFKNSFRNTTKGSNGLDPDQDQCFVIPDLGPISRQQVTARKRIVKPSISLTVLA